MDKVLTTNIESRSQGISVSPLGFASFPKGFYLSPFLLAVVDSVEVIRSL
jgi:hypothetical protein